MVSGEGIENIPLVGENSWKDGKGYAYDFYTFLTKFLSTSLSDNFHGADGTEELIRKLI